MNILVSVICLEIFTDPKLEGDRLEMLLARFDETYDLFIKEINKFLDDL